MPLFPPSGGSGPVNGDIVYASNFIGVNVNSVTDITILTTDINGAAVDDKYLIDAWFYISNDSGLTKTYTLTVDFDNAFDIEISTTALANGGTFPFHLQAVCHIFSTTFSYMIVDIQGPLATAVGLGNTTMATTLLNGMGVDLGIANLTGTLTINFKVRTSNATPTQNLTVLSFTVRKVIPT